MGEGLDRLMLTLMPSLISSRQEGRQREEDGSETAAAPPELQCRDRKSMKTVKERKSQTEINKQQNPAWRKNTTILNHHRFVLQEI